MIPDLNKTIRNVLETELPTFNQQRSAIDITFNAPTRSWSSELNKPTINLFLLDIRQNQMLSQAQWQMTMTPRPNGIGTRPIQKRRSPLRMDCHYMVTCWTSDPQDEHRLLSYCLMSLARHPILEGDVLFGSLAEQTEEIPTWLAVHDKLTNSAELWGSLDNTMRSSISYAVNIAFSPWDDTGLAPAVRHMEIRWKQTDPNPTKQLEIERSHDPDGPVPDQPDDSKEFRRVHF